MGYILDQGWAPLFYGRKLIFDVTVVLESPAKLVVSTN
jgi:hypothetical protein